MIIVIPARYASSRFPGKPLASIAGVSMLERVWKIASAVKNIDQVIIATEDQRIIDHAATFGATAMLTSDTCRNGTERSLAVVEQLPVEPKAVVNLQGDAVLTPPWVVQALVDKLHQDDTAEIVTPAVVLSPEHLESLIESKKITPASGTTVVLRNDGKALYFSKTILPFMRADKANVPVRRHIGLYGYRTDMLKKLAVLPETPLEKVEGLEQLRALEHGISIDVVDVEYRGRSHWSVDSPEDIVAAEKLIAEEGELI